MQWESVLPHMDNSRMLTSLFTSPEQEETAQCFLCSCERMVHSSDCVGTEFSEAAHFSEAVISLVILSNLPFVLMVSIPW